MSNNKLDQLIDYAQRGWRIFPLHWIMPRDGSCSCGNTKCTSPGKHPILSGGFKIATRDQPVIQGWNRTWPDANWGMRTGSIEGGGSGILVVDIDRKNQGFDSWDALVANDPDRLDTVTVVTGNLGLHYWFRYPEGFDIGISAGKLGVGLDVRGNGGYVVVPPSITANPYHFEYPPDAAPVLDLPGWLLEELTNLDSPSPGIKPKVGKPVRPGKIPQGQRHQKLVAFAAALRTQGFDYTEILDGLFLMRKQWLAGGDHPVSDDEIEGIVKWITSTDLPHNTTDSGNALRFAEQHRGVILYCPRRNTWLVWDGCRWVVGDKLGALALAKETVKCIHHEAVRSQDKKTLARIKKHANRSEAASMHRSMLYLAQTEVAIRDIRLDSHHDFITTRSGILHLPSGVLQPHDPEFYFTRMIDLDYNPEAECPNWLTFLEMVTQGDQDLMRFLQVAVGYTLTGYVDEQALFYLHGDGANGKTTFVETIRRMMGEYAENVPIESLMDIHKAGSGPKPEIAKINGARMVLTSEVPFNRKLNESLVKTLTGGDTITARGLYQDEVSFPSTYKLYVVGNHVPRIIGSDEGIMRRFHMIPFNYAIPREIRRPMRLVMAEFEAEMDGIFAWAVVGCKRWFKEGLKQVGAVREATKEFRSDQDILGLFLSERCLEGEEFKVAKDLLYQAWREWCEGSGEFEAGGRSKKWLTRQMIKRGCEHAGQGGKFLQGLGLRN